MAQTRRAKKPALMVFPSGAGKRKVRASPPHKTYRWVEHIPDTNCPRGWYYHYKKETGRFPAGCWARGKRRQLGWRPRSKDKKCPRGTRAARSPYGGCTTKGSRQDIGYYDLRKASNY
jgi:hypothetical protein